MIQAVKQAEAAAENALHLSRYQATTDAEEVDLNLIEALLGFVSGAHQQGTAQAEGVVEGAVLVFLPGEDTCKIRQGFHGERH